MPQVKLSVIMPVFNVEKTIKEALDSVLMQEVNFPYEIIICNDCSTDNTLNIINEYKDKFNNIIFLNNATNSGNAISFYNALCIAKGDYFCVLDGDDFYTVRNKLQKQVDFLDSDEKENYAGVCHNYLTLFDDGKVLSDFEDKEEKDFSYVDFLNKAFYYHTSTYMYRNIFKDNILSELQKDELRGDNPRTFLVLKFHGGKIKKLKFIGSVYRWSQLGIYSSLTEKKQRERNIKFLSYLKNNFADSIFEKNKLDKQIQTFFDLIKSNDLFDRVSGGKDVQALLKVILNEANRYAFSPDTRDFIFSSIFKSEYLDSLCESIGRIILNEKKISPLIDTNEFNENTILITLSALNPQGGGIYQEVLELIEMYDDRMVYLLLTNMEEVAISDTIKDKLNQFKNLNIIYAGDKSLSDIFDVLIKLKPFKIYHYKGHNNVFANCLNQRGLTVKNICLFSFDHGFSFGLDNSSYDYYISKRPSDYKTLEKYYEKKVLYIPCPNKDYSEGNHVDYYNPLSNQGLTTATAVARFYKLQAVNGLSYSDFIIKLLQKTKGKHIHYGDIPKEIMNSLHQKIEDAGLDKSQFIHIPWANNLGKSMQENKVDLFIEPFPIVSYKISLIAMSFGFPIIAYNGKTRMKTADFIYKEAFIWNDVEQFFDIIENISAEQLKQHSLFSRNHFEQYHNFELIKRYIKNETSFQLDTFSFCYNSTIPDISASLENDFKKKIKIKIKLILIGLLLILDQITLLNRLIPVSIKLKLYNKVKFE